MHSRLQFLANIHFQLNWSSFAKWPSYWRVPYHLVLRSGLSFNESVFKNHTHKQRWNIPVAFHIFNQLDQPRYRLPIATPIYWQSGSPQTFLPRFTTRATNMVNYSLSKDLLFPQLKHGVELEAGRNVCIAAQCLDTRATAAIVFTIKRPKQANSHMWTCFDRFVGIWCETKIGAPWLLFLFHTFFFLNPPPPPPQFLFPSDISSLQKFSIKFVFSQTIPMLSHCNMHFSLSLLSQRC